MNNYELAEKLKFQLNNDPVFRKKFYASLFENYSDAELSKNITSIQKLMKDIEDLIMRDIRY